MNVILSRSEESLIIDQSDPVSKSEMFESLALCFAFRCSASLNMTALFMRIVPSFPRNRPRTVRDFLYRVDQFCRFCPTSHATRRY